MASEGLSIRHVATINLKLLKAPDAGACAKASSESISECRSILMADAKWLHPSRLTI